MTLLSTLKVFFLAVIAAKRTNLTPEEAKELAVRAVRSKKERGRLPSISAADAWAKRMADGAAAFVRRRGAVLHSGQLNSLRRRSGRTF